MPKKAAIAKGQALFERLQLDGLWRRKPKDVSGGQKCRLDIVMALIHSPGLVFLDESTQRLLPSPLSADSVGNGTLGS